MELVIYRCQGLKEVEFTGSIKKLEICGIDDRFSSIEQLVKGLSNLKNLVILNCPGLDTFCESSISSGENVYLKPKSSQSSLETLRIDNVNFSKLGNGTVVFPDVDKLDISNTPLNDINGISTIFPNVKVLILNNDRNLTDITPLREYNKRIPVINLYETSIDMDMLDVLKVIGPNSEYINSDYIDKSGKYSYKSTINIDKTPLFEKLATTVITPKGPVPEKAGQALYKVFGNRGNITLLDMINGDVWESKGNMMSTVNLYSGKPIPMPVEALPALKQYPEISSLINGLILQVTYPEISGDNQPVYPNFSEIVRDLDETTAPNEGRQTCIELMQGIPDFTDKDISTLSNRPGISFALFYMPSYDAKVKGQVPKYSCENMSFKDIFEINNRIKRLLATVDNNGSRREKVETIAGEMRKSFQLMNEKTWGSSIIPIETQNIRRKLSNGIEVSVPRMPERDKNNNLVNAIETGIITSNQYIFVVYELLRRLNIPCEKIFIRRRNFDPDECTYSITEPTFIIKSEDGKNVITLNGRTGEVSIEDIEKLEEFQEY